jgi:hypothetical protein
VRPWGFLSRGSGALSAATQRCRWQPGRSRPRIDTFAKGVKLIVDDHGLRTAVPPGRMGLGGARESRARHVIAVRAADGAGTNEIVRMTGVSEPTVIAWKRR